MTILPSTGPRPASSTPRMHGSVVVTIGTEDLKVLLRLVSDKNFSKSIIQK